MGFKEQAKENAIKADQLMELVDTLRTQADAIERAADELYSTIPAVFVEKAHDRNTKLYISTACIVGQKAEVEDLGPYESFVTIEMDSTAHDELVAALAAMKR